MTHDDTPESLLDLSFTFPLAKVTFDGKTYTMRDPAEMSIKDMLRSDRYEKRVVALQNIGKDDKTDDEADAEADAYEAKLNEATLFAYPAMPSDVVEKLKGQRKLKAVTLFFAKMREYSTAQASDMTTQLSKKAEPEPTPLPIKTPTPMKKLGGAR